MVLNFWKRATQPKSVYESLTPLPLISLLSLAPFKLNVNKNKEVYTSKLFYLAGVFNFLFYVMWFTLEYVSAIQNKNPPKRLGGFVTMLTTFGFAIVKRQNLINIIRNNIVVDDIFVQLGRDLNYKRISQYCFLASIGLGVFNLIYVWVTITEFLGIGDLMIFVLPHVNTIIIALKFLCITHLIETRFRLLNEILQDILETQKEQITTLELSPVHSYIPQQNTGNIIKQVSQIHSLLCNICEAIDEYFSYPFLFTIAISSFLIVINSYFIATALLEGDSWNSFLWNCTVQVVWGIAFVILIVEASRNITSQSTSSANIVYDIINITNDNELRDRLFRLSQQLTNRKVSFTAAGLFELDRTLLLAMAGTATCYIIILSDHADDTKATNSTNLTESQ